MSVPGTDEGLSVQVTGLVKTYSPGGQVLRAVDGVDLDVAAGEFVALTGPSGSGKSTLLHLIGALDRPDAGTITVGSTDVTALQRRRLPDYRRRVGFVFQRYHLLPALTALDNVLAPALPRRPGREQQALARELLGQVGLAGREDALPSRLSGGQQQRVAIARALFQDPGLLLADEPTGNLDQHTGQQVLSLLAQLRSERGTTILLVTHDQSVAEQADRAVQLVDGKVQERLAHDSPWTSPDTDNFERVKDADGAAGWSGGAGSEAPAPGPLASRWRSS